MEASNSRRQFLRVVGGAVASAGVLGTVTASERPRGEQPRAKRSGSNGRSSDTPRSTDRPSFTADTTASSWTDTRRLTTKPRSPSVGTSVENLPLSSGELWVDCQLVPGETYRLRSLVEGSSGTADKAAMIRFDGAEGGQGLAIGSANVGAYIYLRTGPGLNRTDRLFTVNKPTHRYGLRSWGNRSAAILKSLTIERVDQRRHPTDFFLSFDVEALTQRAPGDWIDRLVWGKLNGEEYGLRRICKILEQYGLKAIFLIDFASCTRDGDGPLKRIVEFLASNNHEIQMHLHPRELAQRWGLRVGRFDFDSYSYDTSRRMLDFTLATHRRTVGVEPRVFRSGGTLINENLALAAGSLGIEALSNVRNKMVGEPEIGGDFLEAREPFVWDNGVIEIPVDYTAELSRNFERYSDTYDQIIKRKTTERTYNLLFHSWSLIRQSDRGFREIYEPEYESRFHEICSHIAQYGTARGYGDYLDAEQLPRPVVQPVQILATGPKPELTVKPKDLGYVASADIAACSLCDMRFSRSAMESDRCPSCGGHARHRQLKHVLDNFGNIFDGKNVLAHDAVAMRIWGFLSGAKSVQEFDLANGIDGIKVGSVDCVVGLHLMSQVMGGDNTIGQIARVLKPGGVFVSTTPYRADAVKRLDGDLNVPLRLKEYVNLLSTRFVVTSVPGYDAVTGTASRIFFANQPS